jgi:hypothetical protein
MEALETDFGPGPASGAADPLFFAQIIGSVYWPCPNCGYMQHTRFTPRASVLRCKQKNCKYIWNASLCLDRAWTRGKRQRVVYGLR